MAPKGGARPTTDRLKEALFASLGRRVDDAYVLDLYAGSGALAIEALSRGAARAVLVDREADAAAAIGANLDAVGFGDVAMFRRAAVATFLAGPATGAPFDLVFLDPPYDVPAAEVARVLGQLASPPWLSGGATVVIERPKSDEPVVLPAGWRIEKERSYGDTLLVVAHAS